MYLKEREGKGLYQTQHSKYQTAQPRSSSRVPEGAALSMAQLRWLGAVIPLRANGAISSYTVTLDTISSFATWKYRKANTSMWFWILAEIKNVDNFLFFKYLSHVLFANCIF